MKNKGELAMKEKKSKIRILKPHIYLIAIGIILVLIGLFIRVPGAALTTLKSLDGVSTAYYALGNSYSAIDEYVGGDAYNYIIGATLVAAKITGAMTARAIFIVGGLICFALGFALKSLMNKDEHIRKGSTVTAVQASENILGTNDMDGSSEQTIEPETEVSKN